MITIIVSENIYRAFTINTVRLYKLNKSIAESLVGFCSCYVNCRLWSVNNKVLWWWCLKKKKIIHFEMSSLMYSIDVIDGICFEGLDVGGGKDRFSCYPSIISFHGSVNVGLHVCNLKQLWSHVWMRPLFDETYSHFIHTHRPSIKSTIQ